VAGSPRQKAVRGDEEDVDVDGSDVNNGDVVGSSDITSSITLSTFSIILSASESTPYRHKR
jgi:hypothetical protein